MEPLIKWPGGKAREINKIEKLIPNFDRYIEPFFGGGALYFYLKPEKAAINDNSKLLIEFYRLLKEQDKKLLDYLNSYNSSFKKLMSVAKENIGYLRQLFFDYFNSANKTLLDKNITAFLIDNYNEINSGFTKPLISNQYEFFVHIHDMVIDKYERTVANHRKSEFSTKDLEENLITGFTSGYYMYFRKIYNNITSNKIENVSTQYVVANFYFIREYCYGSMFRYNSQGEFNIPYGGISYNKKNFFAKIKNMFNSDVKNLFKNTEIQCSDFEEFINQLALTENDFLFLDPPYDTDFSEYEGKGFTHYDQERLAKVLKSTKAKFILIIKNTDFIYNLYKDTFKIISFDKQYTYNVRSRNLRNVEHLIITNY